MEKTKKMTKRDHFKTLLSLDEVKSNSVLVDFINHELELLDKKNASEKKPTANQVANETFKTAILAGMETGRLYTVTEIQKSIPEVADLTNQRVSAILRLMCENDKTIVRTEDKRKAYFSKAE